jgi:hypothetical protein
MTKHCPVLIVSLLLSFLSTASNAEEGFSKIATECALKYEVEIGRNEKEEIEEVAGSVSLDFTAFLLIFPEEDRAKIASAWLECLAPNFEPTASGSGINPSAQTAKLIWDFPHVEDSGLALGVINVRDGGSGVDVNFRLRNTSSETLYVMAGNLSYTDSNGNVCAKGSLTTWISGDISWREDDDLTKLPPGQSVQYVAENIRCDSGDHSTTGDVIASVGRSPSPNKGDLEWISFEIARVRTLQ